MSNYNKSLMSPDHVLSLVIVIISALLIFSGIYLYRAQAEYHDSGAAMQKSADRNVYRLNIQRKANQENQDLSR